MDEYTKEELIIYIEKLKKKLSRYETKFSALVDAYKNLTAEKQVLENTLTTLSKPRSAKASPISSPDVSLSDPLGAQVLNASVEEKQQEDKNSTATCSPEELISSYEEKISALNIALQSVTDSKKKMESAFQADKKALMTDFKSQIEQFQEEKKQFVKQEQELKFKLCQEQNGRESEVKVHASMLKELQEILSTERLEKDELRTQLNEKANVKASEEKAKVFEYEDTIAGLHAQVHSLKDELLMLEREKKKPDNTIKDLTAEVQKIKLEHNIHLEQEQERANDAEATLKIRQKQEEERLAELECRLSQLSAMVGTYEKQRQEDQSEINKLRGRLEALHTENSVLTTTSSSSNVIVDIDNDNKVTELNDQLLKLKNLLKISWKKHDKGLGATASTFELDEILKTDLTHLTCRAEYTQLKDEFEAYKENQKHTVKLKNKDERAVENAIEYKHKIEKLENEIQYLRTHHDEEERENMKVVSKLQVDITRTKEDYENQIETLKNEQKITLSKVEEELHKQRTRTVQLLSEKELEIERLQRTVFAREDDDQKLKHERSMSERSSNTLDHNASIVDEMLVHSPTQTGGSGSLFHYTQQLSHYETELSLCRSQIINLESDARDAEHREQQMVDQMQALKEEIRRLERGRSRESANLEYLKNITLRYMLAVSLPVKKQMAHTIATVLLFSPDEIKQIEKMQKSGWW